jgi:hypothetical protein
MRVYLNTDWSRYASKLAGFTMLGVICHDNGDAGALALTPLGKYIQVNGALIRELNQDAVKVELGIARREEPPTVELDCG